MQRDYIVNVKAKEVSVALNNMGQLLVWDCPSSLKIIIHRERVDDFDICKGFVLFRCQQKYYKWRIREKVVERVHWENRGGEETTEGV
jgi:hypothetical protein